MTKLLLINVLLLLNIAGFSQETNKKKYRRIKPRQQQLHFDKKKEDKNKQSNGTYYYKYRYYKKYNVDGIRFKRYRKSRL